MIKIIFVSCALLVLTINCHNDIHGEEEDFADDLKNIRQNIRIGKRERNQYKAHSERVRIKAEKGKIITKSAEFKATGTIIYITAKTLYKGSSVEITDGGLGHNHVTFEFKSAKSRALVYQLSVYIRKNDKLTKTTKFPWPKDNTKTSTECSCPTTINPNPTTLSETPTTTDVDDN